MDPNQLRSDMDLVTFLTEVPPGSPTRVELEIDIPRDVIVRASSPPKLTFPNIRLHCSSKGCNGVRQFQSRTEIVFANVVPGRFFRTFAVYVCKDCDFEVKVIALRFKAKSADSAIYFEALKLGEEPAFGPPTPSKAMTLIGGDRDLFLKGRRCELQGLGVGAFSYYRRVIENQKSRIFNEFIRVLSAVDPSNGIIPELERAKNETQFSTSLDTIKHALPSSLLVNGHNPIQLLHSALSQGLHAESDEDCLQVAGVVRTVLFATAERLGSALRDDTELANAITMLNKWNRKNP